MSFKKEIRNTDASQLARAVGVHGARLAWLLGAGTSAMSGIPTAGSLILQFKHALYCAANQLAVQQVDIGEQHVRTQVEEYFDDRHGFPPKGHHEEYSVAFEAAYPTEEMRSDFIAKLCEDRQPNYGHYVLAALMATNRLQTVFTTNFDGLIETGARLLFAEANITPRPDIVVAGLGEPDLALRALNKGTFPLLAKLHGDFRSIRLKNTVVELQNQDTEMRRLLTLAFQRYGLVVVGYSGRDTSVMETLEDALREQGSFPEGIYWCHRDNESLDEPVARFLTHAIEAGRDVFIVPINNFIELASTIERLNQLPATIQSALGSRQPPSIVTSSALPSGAKRPFPILRLNALPVLSMPTELRCLNETRQYDLKVIRQALRSTRARGLVARRSGGTLVCIGHEEEIAGALGPLGISVSGKSETIDWKAVTIDPADLGLASEALALALGSRKGLRWVLTRKGHQVRVADPSVDALHVLKSLCGGTLSGTIPNTTLQWAECVRISLERRGSTWWLLLVPHIWVSPSGISGTGSRELRLPDAAAKSRGEFVRNRLAGRYNKTANAVLDAWVKLLFSSPAVSEIATWSLNEGEGHNARYVIQGTTAYSRPLI